MAMAREQPKYLLYPRGSSINEYEIWRHLRCSFGQKDVEGRHYNRLIFSAQPFYLVSALAELQDVDTTR